MIITTSWDDGHKLDLKLASLLEKYKLKGTFYIPGKFTKEPLTKDEIIKLSIKHEIGAHTLNHVELDKISLDEIKEEVLGSKNYLENLLSKEIKMFCYPRGKFNSNVKNIVKSSGFIGARSTQKFCFNKPTDYFEMGVSLHVYPFPFRKKDKKRYLLNRFLIEPLQYNYKKIKELKLPVDSYFSWSNLAKNCFDYAIKTGELFHLYGHSWEIEKYGMWNKLETFLKYISLRDNILHLTNSECLDYFNKSSNG